MLRRFLMTTALVTAFAAPAFAADMTKDQIEQIVHDYIMANPQVMIDSVNAFEMSKQTKAEEQFGTELKKNADWLYKNKNHYEAGNPKGDVTVVEFFDHNCGYCKQALNDILTLLDEDKNLRLVFVEIPILGDSSTEAAHWALAAGKQDHYLDYHVALMRHKGPLNDEVLETYAKQVGMDVEKLKKDAKDPGIEATLQGNLDMARTFGIQGTPAFVVGDNIVRGYIGIDGMRDAVKQARAAKKPD